MINDLNNFNIHDEIAREENIVNNNNNSGSFVTNNEVTTQVNNELINSNGVDIQTDSVNKKPPLFSSLPPDEKNIVSLKNRVIELEKLVNKLVTDKLVEDLQLPEEVVKNSGGVKPVKRMRLGVGSVPLLESELLEAQSKTNTAVAAAKYLNVSYPSYKRYCKRYGIWKTNRTYRDEYSWVADPNKGARPLNRILNGEFPDTPVYVLKAKLINCGVKEAKCDMCGFSERRVTDRKMPLLLIFEDGNTKNHKLENLKLFCYNCSFLYGQSWVIRIGKKYTLLDDPDRAQGALKTLKAKF